MHDPAMNEIVVLNLRGGGEKNSHRLVFGHHANAFVADLFQVARCEEDVQE